METFESWLLQKFIETLEFCGRAITKYNCEELFDPWLEDLEPQEFIDYAEAWHKDNQITL